MPPSLSDLPDPPPGRDGWPWTHAPTPLPATHQDGSPWPVISIVTPSYNQGGYIEETIRSILLQGYPALEYVVMDGGSTDETIEVLEKYDRWITHWESKPDDGQADAINQGIEHCSGKIFNWINSDDYLHPQALRTIADGFSGNADAVAGPVINFEGDTETTIVNRGLQPRYMLASSRFSKFHQPGVWLRLDPLTQVLPFDDDLRYCFDTDLYVRYLKAHPRVEYVDTPLVYFRLHEDAKTVGERSKMQREFYHLKRRLMDDGFSEARDVYHQAIERRTWHRVVNRVVAAPDSRAKRAASILSLLSRKEYARLDRFTLASLVRRILMEG